MSLTAIPLKSGRSLIPEAAVALRLPQSGRPTAAGAESLTQPVLESWSHGIRYRTVCAQRVHERSEVIVPNPVHVEFMTQSSTHRSEFWADVWSAYKDWKVVLATVAAGIVAFCLWHNVASFNLSSLFDGMIANYRQWVVQPLKQALAVLGFPALPDWLINLSILWSILATLVARTALVARAKLKNLGGWSGGELWPPRQIQPPAYYLVRWPRVVIVPLFWLFWPLSMAWMAIEPTYKSKIAQDRAARMHANMRSKKVMAMIRDMVGHSAISYTVAGYEFKEDRVLLGQILGLAAALGLVVLGNAVMLIAGLD